MQVNKINASTIRSFKYDNVGMSKDHSGASKLSIDSDSAAIFFNQNKHMLSCEGCHTIGKMTISSPMSVKCIKCTRVTNIEKIVNVIKSKTESIIHNIENINPQSEMINDSVPIRESLVTPLNNVSVINRHCSCYGQSNDQILSQRIFDIVQPLLIAHSDMMERMLAQIQMLVSSQTRIVNATSSVNASPKETNAVNVLPTTNVLGNTKANTVNTIDKSRKPTFAQVVKNCNVNESESEAFKKSYFAMKKPRVNTSNNSNLSLVYVTGIQRMKVSVFKKHLDSLKFSCQKIAFVSFVGQHTAEFLVYNQYKTTFVSHCKSLEWRILDKFDPTKPANSEVESAKVKNAFLARLRSNVIASNKDHVKRFFSEWYLRVNGSPMVLKTIEKSIVNTPKTVNTNSTEDTINNKPMNILGESVNILAKPVNVFEILTECNDIKSVESHDNIVIEQMIYENANTIACDEDIVTEQILYNDNIVTEQILYNDNIVTEQVLYNDNIVTEQVLYNDSIESIMKRNIISETSSDEDIHDSKMPKIDGKVDDETENDNGQWI